MYILSHGIRYSWRSHPYKYILHVKLNTLRIKIIISLSQREKIFITDF